MPLWVQVDVETPTDAKLFSRPVVERHLWTCLLCLAKKEFPDGIIVNYDAAALARRFNLGQAVGVQHGLEYFAAAKPRPMVELHPDGRIELVNFARRQGFYEGETQRERWRTKKRQQRDNARTSNGTTGGPNGDCPTVDLDLEKEEKKKEKKEQVLSSFSLDPEIARASQTDATATEQAKLVHALNLDRKARRG